MRALANPWTALIVAAAMTALAAVEHNLSPQRPFYLVYAALCIAIPLAAGTMRLRWTPLKIFGWIAVIGLPFALQALAGWLIGGLYPAALTALGVAPEAMAEPYYNVYTALPTAIARHAEHWGVSPATLIVAYVAFITLWAGIGEEFFYRGFLHEALVRWGAGVAILIGNLFFAGRHAVQLIGPDYPAGAAAAWVGMSFVLGLAFTAVYVRFRSIWAAVLVHTGFNAIPFAGMLLQ